MQLATESSSQASMHVTPLGTMYSRWTAKGLYSLNWTDADPAERSLELNAFEPTLLEPAASRAQSERLDELIDDYFSTGRTSFSSIEIDTQGWTTFSKRVYQACRQIAPGKTVTYKQLACRVESPAASRAVGAAMSRNRLLLVVPCHRVISADGKLRGFSAPGGLATKQFLLDLETR